MTMANPHGDPRLARAATEPTLTLSVPLRPTDDHYITCVVCGQAGGQFEFFSRTTDRRQVPGLHARCADRLQPITTPKWNDPGCAASIVDDIKIAGGRPFLRSGAIACDMCARNAVTSSIRFEVAKAAMDVEIIVTYVGTQDKGCPLFASITGMEYAPGLLD